MSVTFVCVVLECFPDHLFALRVISVTYNELSLIMVYGCKPTSSVPSVSSVLGSVYVSAVSLALGVVDFKLLFNLVSTWSSISFSPLATLVLERLSFFLFVFLKFDSTWFFVIHTLKFQSIFMYYWGVWLLVSNLAGVTGSALYILWMLPIENKQSCPNLLSYCWSSFWRCLWLLEALYQKRHILQSLLGTK